MNVINHIEFIRVADRRAGYAYLYLISECIAPLCNMRYKNKL